MYPVFETGDTMQMLAWNRWTLQQAYTIGKHCELSAKTVVDRKEIGEIMRRFFFPRIHNLCDLTICLHTTVDTHYSGKMLRNILT